MAGFFLIMSTLNLFSIPDKVRDAYIAKVTGISSDKPATWTFASGWETHNSDTTFFPYPETLNDFLTNDSGIIKENFIENMPKIQIRAYFKNTLTTQIFNLFSSFTDGFSEVVSGTNNMAEAAKALGAEFIKTVEEAREFAEILALRWSSENGMNEMLKALLKGCGMNGFGSVSEYDGPVIHLPYALYYSILGATPSNFYEFPAYIKSGFMDANGSYGWNDDDAIGGLISSSRMNVLHGSKYLNFLMKGMNANFMPVFNPHTSKPDYSTIVVEFDLINDTVQKAQKNYQFMHTLMLNNMWIQFGFVQGPACLYDIKIVGGNRFFMCSGDFKVSYKGTLRKVSFIETDSDAMVPDVYHLSLTFKSLLPNNFNNFMMAKLGRNNIFDTTPDSSLSGVYDIISKNAETYMKEQIQRQEEFKKAFNSVKQTQESTPDGEKSLESADKNNQAESDDREDYQPKYEKASRAAQQAMEKEIKKIGKERKDFTVNDWKEVKKVGQDAFDETIDIEISKEVQSSYSYATASDDKPNVSTILNAGIQIARGQSEAFDAGYRYISQP